MELDRQLACLLARVQDDPVDRRDARDLLSIRGEFLNAKQLPGPVVVRGHSMSMRPEFHARRIGIDAGAHATDVLTCVVLEGMAQRFLSTGRSAERPL